jgi:hypothetical protein
MTSFNQEFPQAIYTQRRNRVAEKVVVAFWLSTLLKKNIEIETAISLIAMTLTFTT